VNSTVRRYIKAVDPFPGLKIAMNKYWYPLISRRWEKEDIVFINWGYEEDPPLGLPLAPEDEPNRYCIQLYHRTATQADPGGKQVLEVSSDTEVEPLIWYGRSARPPTPGWTTTRTVWHSPKKGTT
jgi:hypothetical protein